MPPSPALLRPQRVAARACQRVRGLHRGVAYNRAHTGTNGGRKWRVVELPTHALARLLRYPMPIGLLAVQHPMLHIGHNPVRLDAADCSWHEQRAERGIFAREVLEVAPVAWHAGHAQPRAEHHVCALGVKLLPYVCAPLTQRVRVPRSSHPQSRRPGSRRAGRRYASCAKALRAVVHVQRRNAKPQVWCHVANIRTALRGGARV